MIRRRSALRGMPALVIAAVALGLTACAAASDPDPTMTGDPLGSPLSSYLGAVTGFDDPDWRQQKADDAQRIEESVAECMSDEGFDYVPAVQPVTYSFDRGAAYDPDDAEWVAQWGYGVVTDPVSARTTPEPDPNAVYVGSLGAAEQEAYDVALLGPDPFSGDGGIDADAQGCYGEAYRAVHGDDPRLGDAHETIEAAIQAFSASEFDAPEYAEVDADWASCMADAEHSGFTRQGDAEQSIRDAIGRASDQAGLDALHDDEVDLALADLACREEVDYRSRAADIQATLEEQFIADHKAELDALVADAEAQDR